jgi:hypothetical protein
MITIKVNVDDAASGHLDKLQEALDDKAAINLAVVTGAEEALKENLLTNYVPRNQRGNFWERVFNSTESHSDDDSATITMSELGIRLRIYGGDVRPGVNPAASGPRKGLPTKALAIPSSSVPVVDGRQLNPAAMGLLAYLSGKGGDSTGYLVEGEEVKRTRDTAKGKKGSTYVRAKSSGALLYTLRSITRHKGDDNIINEDEMGKGAVDALADYFDSFS